MKKTLEITSVNFILSLLAILLILLAFELLLKCNVINMPWANCDICRRNTWIKRHDINNPIFRPTDGPTKMMYHPTRGWCLQTNLDNFVYNPIFPQVSTNSKGLRDKKEYSYENRNNKFRIVVIGDSFTFGHRVSNNETYSFLLERMLDNVEVINMGVEDYGTDQQLIYLKEEGVKYKPDLIILGFMSDSIHRNILLFSDFAKPRFILKSNKLVLTNTPVPGPEAILRKDKFHLKSLDYFSIYLERIKDITGYTEQKEEKITRAIFEDITHTATSIGAQVLFLYIPWEQDLNVIIPEEMFFMNFYKPKEILWLNLKPILKKYQEEAGIHLWDDYTGHWNQDGHRLVAEILKEFIEDRFMKCRL